MVSFVDRLKEAMKDAGVTEAALARHLGTTPTAINKIDGVRTKSMNAENCAKAARFLGVSGYWLATGDGEKTGVDDWPFPEIDLGKFNRLGKIDRDMIQGAILLVAAQRQLDIGNKTGTDE